MLRLIIYLLTINSRCNGFAIFLKKIIFSTFMFGFQTAAVIAPKDKNK